MIDRRSRRSVISNNHIPVCMGPLITDGIDRTRTTAGTYTRRTGRIWLKKPMLVKKIFWDMYAAGTYKFEFITSGTDTTQLYLVDSAKTIVNGENEITPVNGDFVLLAGKFYYPSYYISTAVQSDDKGSEFNLSDNIMFFGCYHNTTYGAYSIPIKLCGIVLDYCPSVYEFLPAVP